MIHIGWKILYLPLTCIKWVRRRMIAKIRNRVARWSGTTAWCWCWWWLVGGGSVGNGEERGHCMVGSEGGSRNVGGGGRGGGWGCM